MPFKELGDKLERISGDMHWQLLHDSAEAIRELVRQRALLLHYLSEAEVYSVYGRYDQALDEIRKAIASVKGQA